MKSLDEKFIDSLIFENVERAFNDLKNSKTDILPDDDGQDEIHIYPGSDGITYQTFEGNLQVHASIICDKGKTGKYCFEPFKEHKIPKPPFTDIEDAIKAGKELAEKKMGKEDKFIRVLSMSTIQDTIFQKLMANVLDKYAEEKFSGNIDLNSYGYRKNKSSKMAVRKIRRFVDEGYVHILDGDIRGFFDEINHTLLLERLNIFFGEENMLLHKFLYRFVKVRKIESGDMQSYKHDKNVAKSRSEGIPQGGVLSGLLANIFLYNFDLYIVNVLMQKYSFQYLRYADDFVLMFKNEDDVKEVYDLIKYRLRQNDKLYLHDIGEKTKKLNLSIDSFDRTMVLDFLGFEISPKRLRIKKDNVKKFRNRINQVLTSVIVDMHDSELSWDEVYFNSVVRAINLKIVGLESLIEQNDGVCLNCKKLIPKRSWIGYFMIVTDVEQLREIDTIIRKAIYQDYKRRTGKHIRKREMLRFTSSCAEPLKSVVKMYYKYRKQVNKYGNEICKCDPYFDRTIGKIRRK